MRDIGGAFDDTRSLCAHFRLDVCRTGGEERIVLLGFRSSEKHPRIQIVEFTKKWEVVEVPIGGASSKLSFSGCIPGLNYVHDLLVSEHFYVLQMTPFVHVSRELTMEVLGGKSSVGEQMRLYEEEGRGKIVVIEREPGKLASLSCFPLEKFVGGGELLVSGRRVFLFEDIAPCHIYHFGYCVEEVVVDEGSGGRLRLRFNACCLPENFSMYSSDKLWLANSNEAPGELWDYTLDFNPPAQGQHGPGLCLNRTRTQIRIIAESGAAASMAAVFHNSQSQFGFRACRYVCTVYGAGTGGMRTEQ